jgi:hypothetical protein
MNGNQSVQENVPAATPPVQSTTPVSLKPRSNKLLTLIVVHLITILTLGYFVLQYSLLKRQVCQPQPTPTAKILPKIDTSKSIDLLSAELTKIFRGEIEFSDPYNNGVSSYSKNVEFPSGMVMLVVYKYTPGQIMLAGYEGGTRWNIHMDAWVGYLSSLKMGQVSARRVDYWEESDKELPILVKRLGTKLYGIYDSSFKPAGTCSRNFVTYDQTNKQIVTISANTGCGEVTFPADSATFNFPMNHLEYLNKVEGVINST